MRAEVNNLGVWSGNQSCTATCFSFLGHGPSYNNLNGYGPAPCGDYSVKSQSCRKINYPPDWCSDSNSGSCCSTVCEQLSEEHELGELKGLVWEFATDKHGCRMLQDIIGKSSKEDWPLLETELQGKVVLAACNPNANFVLQKIIVVVPHEDRRFIVEECIGHGRELAMGEISCRILCRIIEHDYDALQSGEQTNTLISEVLQHASELCNHKYACHVMKSVLKHGQAVQKEAILKVLCEAVLKMAMDRYGSWVVETALEHCNPADSQGGLRQILRQHERILEIATHRFGWHVVAALAKRDDEWTCHLHRSNHGSGSSMASDQGTVKNENVRATLLQHEDMLKGTAHGKRLWESLFDPCGCVVIESIDDLDALGVVEGVDNLDALEAEMECGPHFTWMCGMLVSSTETADEQQAWQ